MKKPKPQIAKRQSSYRGSYRRLSDDQDRYMAILVEIINRRKRKIPFPVKMLDVYFDLFPAYVKELYNVRHGTTERERGIAVRKGNLMDSFAKSERVAVELDGARPVRAFFMRFELPMIVPAHSGTTLQMPHNHRYMKEVAQWVERAQVFDNRRDDIINKLAEFFRACDSDAVARKVWPFIMDAVKATAPCHPVGPTAIAHVDHVVSRTQRGYIETTIAEGMMLDPYVPDAWIGYGPEG